MPITRFEDLDLSRRYTYADYLTWEFKERVELLRGWVSRMIPAPNTYHQQISGHLSGWMFNTFKTNQPKWFAAPFDVRLSNTAGGETVVQPDLCVVCDSAKITDQECVGPPDWIIEIVSPGNGSRNLETKYALYEEAGVKEYWVVHPLDRTVLRYIANGEGNYVGLAPKTENSSVIEVGILAGLRMSGADIFP